MIFNQDQKANVNPNHFSTPYKFNGKELDEETGLYYYGARYYNPQVSVWLAVDPLAEKYPNLSSYAFMANNPIMLIDPNGESIWVTGDDGSATGYTPGMSYDGEDEFTRKAIVAYNKAYHESDKAKEVINALVESDSKYNVKKSSNSKYIPGGRLIMKDGEKINYHEKDAGGTIYWNPEGTNFPTQSNKSSVFHPRNQRSSIAGLMHETAHGYDQVKGTLPTRDTEFSIRGFSLPVQEWQATHIENINRAEMNMPLRTPYGINKYNGSPEGPSLLKMKGNTIISSYMYEEGVTFIYRKL